MDLCPAVAKVPDTSHGSLDRPATSEHQPGDPLSMYTLTPSSEHESLKTLIGNGRVRTLGCKPICSPVPSNELVGYGSLFLAFQSEIKSNISTYFTLNPAIKNVINISHLKDH